MNNRWLVDLYKNRLEGSSSVFDESLHFDFSVSSLRSPGSYIETRILSHKEVRRRAEKALKRQEEQRRLLYSMDDDE
jgi:hypothetical protein